jgi:hypothetical protein
MEIGATGLCMLTVFDCCVRREELGREDLDKYVSDTYKLIVAGVVVPEPGHKPW